MSSTAAQIQFAAEFVTFLVAAAGLALIGLRAELATFRRWEKVTLAVGFAAMGTAAFGHGSLLLTGSNQAVVDGLRLAGVVGLGLGSRSWESGGRPARRLVAAGLLITAGSVAAQIVGAGRVADGLLVGGSILIGAALLLATRRSVAARVAATAAGTLLLVVLVLSVALSAVLSSSAQREELNRLGARAKTEALLASDSPVNEVGRARDAAYALAALFQDRPAALTDPQVVSPQLNNLGDLNPVGGLAYLVPPGHVIASNRIDMSTVQHLASTDLVQTVRCPSPPAEPRPTDHGSTQVIDQHLLAVAAVPVCPRPPRSDRPVGVVLRVLQLDPTYLQQRYISERSVSLAFADPNGMLAEAGLPQATTGTVVRLAGAVVQSGLSATEVNGKRFLAAYPIQAGDKFVAAVVVSEPTSTLISTRDRLYRTLFLIALGGTLLAFGLAALIGDRITAGLRRLTYTARSIQRGEIGQRAEIGGEDEVGVLGAAFDSMAASIEEKTGALQVAADDETRLRNRLEAVVAGMGDALIAIDSDGRITDFNQAAEELIGVSAARARGKPVDEVLVLVNEDGSSLGPRLRSPAPNRWGVLATAVQIGGAEVPVAVSAGALRGPFDEVTGSVLVLRDLRREREVEQMKTEFLSRIGHELRTPLTGIMGYADILRRRDVDPARAARWHEEILEAAKRLLRVVEMLEFFASSGAGRVLLRPERLNVRNLIDDMAVTWADRLPTSHTLVHRVARDTGDVQADRRWLSLAIDELVDNAVKFSPDGGRVAVTALSVPEDGVRNGRGPLVEISVIDRGKGMTAQEQATAFGEFVQGDSSDTRRFGGLGLGLSLVQRVVEGHGGSVRCSSSTGHGTTFTIVLPAVALADHS